MEDIKVGDEVQYNESSRTFVVTQCDNDYKGDAVISGFNAKGHQFCDKDVTKWHKTGRHFPAVKRLLNQIAKREQ